MDAEAPVHSPNRLVRTQNLEPLPACLPPSSFLGIAKALRLQNAGQVGCSKRDAETGKAGICDGRSVSPSFPNPRSLGHSPFTSSQRIQLSGTRGRRPPAMPPFLPSE